MEFNQICHPFPGPVWYAREATLLCHNDRMLRQAEWVSCDRSLMQSQVKFL